MQDGLQAQRRGASSRGERLDVVMAVLAVGAFTAPGMLLMGLSDDPNAPPNPMLRLYWPPVYALALLLCTRRWRQLARAWWPAILVALPVVWACASKSWSIMPDDTGRRAFALILTTVFGFGLGAAFTGRSMVQIIAAAGLLLAAGSVVVAIAIPRYGVEQLVNAGDWRGLWDTKNALAGFMMISALAAACAATLADGHRRLWVASFGLCVFDLLMSRGKTSLVCLLLGLALLAAFSLARRGPVRAVLAVWGAGALSLAAGFSAFVVPDALFHAIGKDPTLTGRTQIWAAVLGQVAQRPLTGFGFAAFWNKQSAPAMVVAKQTGWVAPEAHNGWLDLLAQVGWVGLALTSLGCLFGLIFAIRRWGGRDDGWFAPIYLAIFLGMSMAESVLLSGNNLVWVVFVAVLTQLLGPAKLVSPVLRAPRPTSSVSVPPVLSVSGSG
ncbi:O-antigen ligase [Caulobacter sp. S45]|uniref:O-antigen ligase family protein n=1 Tax=Caulobacter sp. S45 TaxID=1641861 RepID=UPI001577228A|nr:O-antigen ligase [Caulobacter sp. S45]